MTAYTTTSETDAEKYKRLLRLERQRAQRTLDELDRWRGRATRLQDTNRDLKRELHDARTKDGDQQ